MRRRRQSGRKKSSRSDKKAAKSEPEAFRATRPPTPRRVKLEILGERLAKKVLVGYDCPSAVGH